MAVLKRLFLVIFLIVARANVCSANDTLVFCQMIVDGLVIGQIEGLPPEDCKSIHDKVIDGVKYICSTETKELELPYSYTGKNTVSGALLIYRARTMKACQIMNDSNRKNNEYTFTDCK